MKDWKKELLELANQFPAIISKKILMIIAGSAGVFDIAELLEDLNNIIRLHDAAKRVRDIIKEHINEILDIENTE